MADSWFLARDRQKLGPFSTAQLCEMAASGQLGPGDMVLGEGTARWVPAGSVAGLFPPEPAGAAPAEVAEVVPVEVEPVPVVELVAEPIPEVVPLRRPIRRRYEDDDRPRRGRRPDEDRLEGYWYAILWGSILVPVVGVWVIVVLSSVMYYAWRANYPGKARKINLHGWLAWLTGNGFYLLLWLLLSWLGLGLPGGQGTELTFNGGQLLFTRAVTRDEAERLGPYLVRKNVFDGSRVTVQLDRSDRVYKVRLVVRPGGERDVQLNRRMRDLSPEISRDVFGGAFVDIELCDSRLNTLTVISPWRE
jgi:hypothetical protein